MERPPHHHAVATSAEPPPERRPLASSRTDALVSRYVAVWWAAGVAALVTCVWLLWVPLLAGEIRLPLFTVLGLVVLATLAGWWPLETPLRRAALSTNLYEAVFIVGITLLPAVAVPLVMAAGVGVSLLFKGLDAQKWTFNLAMHLAAATLGALGVHVVVGGPIDPTSARGAAVMVGAGFVYGAANIGAMIGLLHVLRDREGRILGDRTFLVEVGLGLLISISLGVLMAVVLAAAPWVTPLVIVPILLTRRVLAAGTQRIASQEAERERLDRTISGASEGICLLDRAGAIELLNPSAVELLSRRPADAIGRRLDDLLTGDGDDAPIHTALAACTPDSSRQVTDLTIGERILSVEVSALFEVSTRADAAMPTGAVVLLEDVTDAREEESMRREFLARVSHELRTPLTAIVGFTETLRTHAGELDEERRGAYLEVIERHGHHLGRLVDDLLWSARTGAGKVQVEPESVPLRQLLTRIEVGLRPTLEGTSFTWEVGDVTVRADPRHVEQILTNLVTNAVRYGAPPVTISASVEGGRAVIDVTDAGPGVQASFVPHLFTPFEQASVGDRRESRGLGLGLAIVASLVELNDGTIEYRRRDGRSVFRVTLPAAGGRTPGGDRTSGGYGP